MGFTYLEHTADIGIRAEGESIEAAFASGVEAVLNVIFDLATVNRTVAITFAKDARDITLLFVEVINEVLSIGDRHGLALVGVNVKSISPAGDGWRFIGTIYGEPINLEKHTPKTEVKAATYSGLSYNKGEKGNHVFECLLDV